MSKRVCRTLGYLRRVLLQSFSHRVGLHDVLELSLSLVMTLTTMDKGFPV